MPLCEGCPRANDPHKKSVEQKIKEAHERGEPIRAQLADTAFTILDFGDCPGRKEPTDGDTVNEFGGSGYRECQHTTEAAADTIISQGTHVLDELARKTRKEEGLIIIGSSGRVEESAIEYADGRETDGGWVNQGS